jgi:hypothetical protein
MTVDNDHSFLLVAQDGFDDWGSPVSGLEIAEKRLSSMRWPVYEHTKNRRRISKGNKVFIYIGGSKKYSGHLIAKCRIDSIEDLGNKTEIDEARMSSISKYIKLKNIEKMPPIKLKPVLIEKGIIKIENKKWGAYLMGGIIQVPNDLLDGVGG